MVTPASDGDDTRTKAATPTLKFPRPPSFCGAASGAANMAWCAGYGGDSCILLIITLSPSSPPLRYPEQDF